MRLSLGTLLTLLALLVSIGQAQDLEFVDVTGYSDGNFGHIIGVVQNNTNFAMEYVQIVSSVYGENGDYLDNGFTYTMLDVLLPGEWSPFILTLLDTSNFSRFDYTAQWDRASRTPARNVTVVNHRAATSAGFFQVSGQVRNLGSVPLEYVKVVLAGYDVNDEVVGVGFTYTTLGVLQPGAVSPFEITVMDVVRPISRYELVVQGDPR